LLDLGGSQGDNLQLRRIWAAAYFTLLLGLLWHLGAAIAVVVTLLRRFPPLWFSLYIALAIVGGVVTGLNTFSGKAGAFLLQNLGTHYSCMVTRLTGVANVLGVVASVASIATMHALLVDLDRVQIDELSRRVKAYLLSVYSAAIVLASALLEIYTLFCWSETGSPTHAEANSIALTAGIFFTTLLALTYGPVAIAHHLRLDQLVQAQAGADANFDASVWLGRYGIQTSPVVVLSAMLLPLATGMVTAILETRL